MFLPATPTARRREEQFLIQARLEAIDAKIDVLVKEWVKAPPKPPQDPRVTTLAKGYGRP
jgi:hypothetical protein